MKSTISLEKQILQAKFQFQPTEIWRKLSIFPKQIITKCLQKEYTKRMTSSEILVNPWFNEVFFCKLFSLKTVCSHSFSSVWIEILLIFFSLSK